MHDQHARLAYLVALVMFSALPAACSSGPGRSAYRRPEARPTATIFSPLDLPAPSRLRTGAGAPGPDYWQQQADYVIAASLDADTNEVAGRATVTYTNNSPDALDYVWLHLEQNVFRDDSIGANVGRVTSIGMSKPQGTGVTIDALTSNGADLPIAVYDTLGRVDLDAPIAPGGGRLVFEIAWRFTIPDKAFRRFGIETVEQGTIYEIAQWFPALVVYDDTYGWNTLPYIGTGEFYTDFGDYDVTLTVPRSHLVAATGVLQNASDVYTAEQVARLEQARTSAETVMVRAMDEVADPATRPAGDGPLTWHFKAERVRTFAWASSDAFIQDACGLGDVLVQSVYPKEKHDLWKDSTQMLRTAIEGYNEDWYPYPYPAATNVYGAEGGMEYPMIIFCRGRDERGLYGVTTHEIGHNWFPMIVSNDERRHAWMDEGFNTFTDYYSFGRWFPGEYGRRGNADKFAPQMDDAHRMPIMTHPDHLRRGTLGELQYHKTAVGLVLLREQILGPERFDFAFRTYIRRWAFKSPRPADFFRCMEDAAGADLAWFWRGWFMETGWLDQALGRVTQREMATDAGAGEGAGAGAGTVEIIATIHNRGELVMPVVLGVTYADGTTETRRLPVEVWYQSDTFEARWEAPSRAVEIVIDPERAFPDVRRANNH